MKRGVRKGGIHWGSVALVLLALALAGYVGGGMSGAVVYRDASYGYGGGGGFGPFDYFSGFQFSDFYYQYGAIVVDKKVNTIIISTT